MKPSKSALFDAAQRWDVAAGAEPSIKDDRGRNAVDIAKARRVPKERVRRLEQLNERGAP